MPPLSIFSFKFEIVSGEGTALETVKMVIVLPVGLAERNGCQSDDHAAIGAPRAPFFARLGENSADHSTRRRRTGRLAHGNAVGNMCIEMLERRRCGTI